MGGTGPDPGPGHAVRVLVVGTFTVEVDASTAVAPRVVSRKARTLLKLLAVERGHLVSTDHIVEVLWPDGPPARAVENVATLVSRLRSWLGPRVVEGGREGYRLGAAVEVDVDVAERLTVRAEQALHEGHSGVALVPAEQAVALLTRGAVLEDDAFADWAEPARDARRTRLRRARLALILAALAVGEPAQAAAVATVAIDDDPLDEEMARQLMTAHRNAGEPARALAVHARLRQVLADELGANPAPETDALHAALLREESLPGSAAPAGGATRAEPTGAEAFGLVEREQELAQLRAGWGAAAAGRPSVLLVVGEAGIGKTSLAEALAAEVDASGGRVLRVRCYEAERSLFLQPLVDAVGPVVAALPPHRLRELAGAHADALARLLPEAALALGPVVTTGHRADEARRAVEAVLHLLNRLASDAPVLLLLDDLHNAGTSTIEAVHYIARRGRGARLLVVATVRREEGAAALEALAGVGDVVEPAVLSEAGVARLAVAAGAGEQAAAITSRTRGHPFFVVEVLRGLAAGEESVPDSLHGAVLDRVSRAGEPVARLLRAASVLSAEVDPSTVAALLEIADDDAAGRCEVALSARLLTVSGRAYEFANDLIREVLYESTPVPTRIAWHRRAADLAGEHHEVMARHAEAAGDRARSARAWLLAAEDAFARVAVSDAQALASRAADAASATGSPDVLGRSLLLRGRASEVRGAYSEAMGDLRAAVEVARDAGDQRLEMTVQRELAGDVPVALGLGTRACDPHVARGLELARGLGDRGMEADLLARRAVIASNRLELRDSLAAGEAAVVAARSSNDPAALVAALDGLKTAQSSIGDVSAMRAVLDELEPQLRRRGDLWRLQWCVFESAYPAVAEGDWVRAEDRIGIALEINRRSGYLAYGTWFEAHLGWVLRLAERHEEALEVGRRAITTAVGGMHPWWRSTACMLLAGTLLEVDEPGEAADLIAEGLATARHDDADAYVLGCQALLADVTGDPAVLAAADAMLRRVQAPDGQVWMRGAESYLAVARAWLAAGDPSRSREVLVPLVAAARSQGWRPVLAQALAQESVTARAAGDPVADALADEAATLATSIGMHRLAARAAAPARG